MGRVVKEGEKTGKTNGAGEGNSFIGKEEKTVRN